VPSAKLLSGIHVYVVPVAVATRAYVSRLFGTLFGEGSYRSKWKWSGGFQRGPCAE
jgi:hypothetical protein